MRSPLEFLAPAVLFFQVPPAPAPAIFHPFSYDSQAMGGSRIYRVALPAGYEKSHQRYPVVYWFHDEEQIPAAMEKKLAAFAAGRGLIVVDAGRAELQGPVVAAFPELVEQIDGTLRTLAGRASRGVSGAGAGGFLALFLAGKYPDLVGSASSISGTSQGYLGPQGFPAEFHLADTAGNYDGVRTRVAESTADALAFYHRRLDAIWKFTRPGFESASFLAGEDLAEIDRTLDFHLAAFADPLPVPVTFRHADVYPDFSVWGWEVHSNRRQPGFTALENVSNTGFRCSVRESLPDGSAIPEVNVTIASPPIYPPGVSLTVTYIRLADGQVRRADQRADARGRLNFELSGDSHEVAIANGPLLTISGYSVTGANWATAGQPVNLRARFWNKGGAPAGTAMIHWESPNPGVKFATPQGRLYALAPGESATLPVTFTVEDPRRAVVQIWAVSGNARLPIEVPLYPAAAPSKDFQIADGRTLTVYRHAVEKAEMRFGEGNGDGRAAPGESFAVLVPDTGGLRAAEVFTNDECVDDTMRGYDSWSNYDHSDASAVFSLPSIHLDCPSGHVVHMLVRILVPNGPETHYQYWTVEFPVWYRNEGK